MSLFLRIGNASDLRFANDEQVGSPELFLAWQASQVTSRRVARVWHADKILIAYINHGRWVVDCPACTMGVLTHPEWSLACCAECGAVYQSVAFPQNWREIEGLLLNRPRPYQNWMPKESAFDLRLENLEHGVVI